MADSIYYNLLLATKDVLEGLSLVGITDASIVIAKSHKSQRKDAPNTLRNLLPDGVETGIIVLPPPGDRERMNPTGGTNVSDEVGYPVGIVMMADDRVTGEGTQSETLDFDKRLLWRQRIRRKFLQPTVYSTSTPAITGFQRTEVEHRMIISPQAWVERNLWLSALVVRAWCWENRETI